MSKIHTITFDLFGTLFDWRGTIIEKGKELNPAADWGKIAIEWARGYSHAARHLSNGPAKMMETPM